LSLARASSFWQKQEFSGILRNPEESGVNTGIPVPQEFLSHRNSSGKNRNSCDLSKTNFLRKIPQENTEEKKILRNPVRNAFLGPKNKFLKRGITNLASSSISISSKMTGLLSPSRNHRAFRRRSIAFTPSIALALAPSIACRRRAVRRRRAATAAMPPPRRRKAAAAVALSRCRHRRCHRHHAAAKLPPMLHSRAAALSLTAAATATAAATTTAPPPS
jgi:hypothetical protein